MNAQPLAQPARGDASPESEARGDLADQLRAILARQRESYLRQGPPSAEIRIDRIDRAIALLVDNQERIASALAEDFGHRSREQSLFTDVGSSIEPLKFAKKHLRRWMRPEKRRAQFPLNLLGARASVRYQPLGVVGVISPWNFPVNLTFGPLAGIFAAGNRVMIKPSEFTPATSALMKRMLESAFDETEVAVVTGGPEVGAAFSSLPFDHLLFTGATSIARHVMKAAAENLVPVTLELGGKSPVVVSESADLGDAATKIMTGKLLNAGQICLAPDYVFVPRTRLRDLADRMTSAVGKMYPTLAANDDYTAVINERHHDRLRAYLDDARAKGAEVVEINPGGEDFSDQEAHKMPPALILDPDAGTLVMEEEIFGPLLPLVPYDDLDQVIDHVNRNPRPLALYYFGKDEGEREKLLERTTSGGVTLNDVIFHVAQEDLPFGGVGASGMGAYHGYDGFKTFSHARSVYRQARIDIGAMLRPPYGRRIRKLLKQQIKK